MIGRRIGCAVGVFVLAFTLTVPGALAHAAKVPAGPSQDLTCSGVAKTGQPLTSIPWPQTQLNFQALTSVTQGRYVSSGTFLGQPFQAGARVPVAVIDSGVDVFDKSNKAVNPVFRGASIAPVHRVEKWRYSDCVGHGTEVSSLIVGQQSGSSYLAGVAPDVHLIPVQYTNSESMIPVGNLIAALSYAISVHPRVINLSLQSSNPPTGPLLKLYQTAERDGIIIVAAGGNESTDGGCGPCWPAALSTKMPNVIAVSAVDRSGQSAGFGVTGNYVDVAAPGVDVPVAIPGVNFTSQMGTSFATPFVTGTVALMLAAHPDMGPAEVKTRLERTAIAPPGVVPDTDLGYGTVNPLQAVTSVEDDSLPIPSATQGPPLVPPAAQARPDRSLQHRALAIAVILFGLAVLTVTGAAIVRGNRNAQTRRSRV